MQQKAFPLYRGGAADAPFVRRLKDGEPRVMQLHTENLRLVLQSTEEILAWVDAVDAATRAEISPDWLARIRTSTTPDPWTHGFTIMHRASGATIGSCAYKGTPDADQTVEIAYGVDTKYQGRGFATEAAQALVEYAMSSGRVRVVRAHTRPDGKASIRVLGKLGFTCVGEVLDPEDGLVLRWERRKEGK
jgi:RimJ/RimL family protein N-acetyltransferase